MPQAAAFVGFPARVTRPVMLVFLLRNNEAGAIQNAPSANQTEPLHSHVVLRRWQRTQRRRPSRARLRATFSYKRVLHRRSSNKKAVMSSRHVHKTTKFALHHQNLQRSSHRSLPCNSQCQLEILSRVSPSIGEFDPLVVDLQLFKRKPIKPATTLCTQATINCGFPPS